MYPRINKCIFIYQKKINTNFLTYNRKFKRVNKQWTDQCEAWAFS